MISTKPTSVHTASFLVYFAAIFVFLVTSSFQAPLDEIRGGRKFARYGGNLESWLYLKCTKLQQARYSFLSPLKELHCGLANNISFENLSWISKTLTT